MKKILVAMLAFTVLSVGMAQSFTVGADYSKNLGAVVEYAHPVDFGSVLFGVRVVPFSWASEVFGGVSIPVATVDTLDISVPVRFHLPVYDGQDLILGQLAVSVGVDVYIPQENGFGLVFGGHVRSNLNADLYSVLPSLYGSVALRYEVNPLIFEYFRFNR
jgi:hypothetical protein